MPQSPFPDYIIKVTDSRFEQVYAAWAYKFLLCIGSNPYLIKTAADYRSFNDTIEISVMFPKTVATIEDQIRNDIARNLPVFKKTHLTEILLSYDTHRYTLEKIRHVLYEIDAKRRRIDYVLRVNSAYSLSILLEDIANEMFNFSLIDCPIPDINILNITNLQYTLDIGNGR